MKLLPLLLATLLSTMPAMAQDGRKQAQNCTWTGQGQLEDSDSRMNVSGAPYDMFSFSAEQGDRIHLRLESTDFKPLVSFFRITETGAELIESDTMPYERTSQIFPWIYEDGTYAVRITPNMRREPGDDESSDSQWPQRGYYTVQISPITCDS